MSTGKRLRGQVVRLGVIIGAMLAFVPASAPAKSVPAKTMLPNGWSLTPAGTLVRLGGDMPLRIVPAPDGHAMLVVTGGFHDHAIDVIDADAGSVRQHVLLGKAWAGLAADGATVYVSGGGPVPKEFARVPEKGSLGPELTDALAKPVLRLGWSGGALAPQAGLAIAGLADKDRFIAGLALDRDKHLLAVNLAGDTLLKVDPANGQVLASVKLGYSPFQLALAPDGARVAVANWGDQSVSMLDAGDLHERVRVPVGIHPTDLAFGPDGRLFVANAGSNSVSVIKDDHVVETVMTSLHAGDPVGTTPNAIAVAPDGSRLYVANADNNDVAVIDIHDAAAARVLGFIPTGWYPSALALTPDGKRLVVGIAKGIGSRANSPAQLAAASNPAFAKAWRPYSNTPFDYIGNVMTGYAEIVPVPDAKALAAYSRQVTANLPAGDKGITIAETRDAEAAFRQIKHVIYVIRENRTYDQVLGDDARGDGKPDLAIFGAAVTPNAHRLAHDTVLLDRYFVNGEVSEDGHMWANQAYATAFNERTTASSYGGRGEPFGDERLEFSPAGHLWDAAKRAGLSYFSYGEGADFTSSQDAPPTFSGTLKDHSSPDWGNFLTTTDAQRAQIFVRDLKAHEEKDDLPAYTVVWLPWDHTAGLTPKAPTPQATVAINDLALGMLVEAVSHSKFWNSTAIFVTEDDAQAGPDHVDDHRSVALVISPYVKQGLVDHTHYTMTSIIRTMELILRLPPMTQYDRGATPMYRLFQARPRDWTYTVQQETVDLRGVNPASGPLEKASLQLDFSGPDRADPQKLNAILWAALRPGKPMPAPVRGMH